MPQTPERKEKGTEKQVHDLTKSENVSSLIEQSIRSLQEMERRLVAMEAEFSRMTGRPPSSPQGASGQADLFRTSSPSGGQFGLQGPYGAAAVQASPQGPPHGLMSAPFGIPGGMQSQPFGLPPGAGAWPIQQGSPFGAPQHWQQHPHQQYQQALQPMFHPAAAMQPRGLPPGFTFAPQAPQGFRQFGLGHAPVAAGFGQPWIGAQSGPVAIGSAPSGAGMGGQFPGQSGNESFLGAASGAMGDGVTRSRDLADLPPQVRQPSMDVLDEGKEFTVHVELPGVKKADLDIMVTERAIVLNAKMRPESEEGVVVHSERPPVLYRRNVILGAEVDTTNAKANLKDGVLTIRVPKRTPSVGPRQLDVAYG